MTQSQIDRGVARATGETASTIRRMGFGIADPTNVCYDPEPLVRPRIVNGDRLDARRPG